MARRSSIDTHVNREAIESAIASGVKGAVIARTYAVSESAVSRHKTLRMTEVPEPPKVGETDPADTMQRVVDLADSARRARQFADATGTPQTKARAQAAELAVLNVLLNRLGVTDLTPIYLSSMTAALAHVVQRIVTERPDTRADVLAMMQQHTALEPLAAQLAAQPQENKK